jgi:hypothetical protein
MAQLYLSVNRRIYLGFETTRAPFSFPPPSHFETPARAKCPHAAVTGAPRHHRPHPEPASTAAAPGGFYPRGTYIHQLTDAFIHMALIFVKEDACEGMILNEAELLYPKASIYTLIPKKHVPMSHNNRNI